MRDVPPRENPAIALLKSAVVIPLAMAIVIGLGWGLVRLAEAEQAKAPKPDPQPATVAKDGTITLQEAFVEVRGESGLWEGHHGPSQVDWARRENFIAWHFRVDTPGRYAVELDCACDPPDAGSKIRIDCAGASADVTVPSTGGWQKFKPLRAGEFQVPSAGWQTLRILPVALQRDTAMNLRDVRLVPVKP